MKNSVLIKIWLVAALYFITGQASAYLFSSNQGNALVVWLPAGVSLASLFAYGPLVSIGIFLGAFAVAVTLQVPFSWAVVIALTNTLFPMASWHFLKKWKIHESLCKELVKTVLFLFIACAVVPLVSASFGSLWLFLAGTIPLEKVLPVAGTWWFGDAIGILGFFPLIFLSQRREVNCEAEGGKSSEQINLYWRVGYFVLHSLACIGFFYWAGYWPFLIFFSIFVGSFYFSARDVAASIGLTSLIAFLVWACARYYHMRDISQEELVFTQVFLSVLSVISMIVTSAVWERRNIVLQLREKNLALERSMASRSEFLLNVSHELRTPLTSILGYTDFLVTQNLKDDQRAVYARNIRKSSRQLLQMIDAILDVAKLEMADCTFQKESVSIKAIIESLEERYAPVARRKGLEFVVVVCGNLPVSISSCKEILENSLSRLLDNAFKFTSSGSVRLQVDMVEQSGDQGLKRKSLVFRVEDTGNGIQVCDRSSLFEPLFKSERAINAKYGGLGTGLWGSKLMFGALGAAVSLEFSEVAKGSVFLVEMPIGGCDDSIPFDTEFHSRLVTGAV